MCRCHHQPGFSSLNRGWHWNAVNVRGDSKRLPDRRNDDEVVITQNRPHVEAHVPRGHVKADAKGVVQLGAGVLEDALVPLDGLGDVHRG